MTPSERLMWARQALLILQEVSTPGETTANSVGHLRETLDAFEAQDEWIRLQIGATEGMTTREALERYTTGMQREIERLSRVISERWTLLRRLKSELGKLADEIE